MHKQKIKGVYYSRTRVKNNILKVWNEVPNEMKNDWYSGALKFAETVMKKLPHLLNNNNLELRLNKVCGIIAALSPRKTWELNKRITYQLIEHRTAPQFSLLVNKAIRILDSDGNTETILKILNGEKIKAFFLNIRFQDKSNVTIDRHALSIALGKKIVGEKLKINSNQYRFIEDCYHYTANKLNINPLLLQSATWSYWRQIK